MRRCRLLVLAACLLFVVAPAPAQEPDPAGAALQAGDYAAARTLLARHLDDGVTEHAPAFAETFLKTGAYEEGLRAVETYLQRRERDPYLLHARGRLLAMLGRYDEAEQAFREALGRRPDFWRNTVELGLLLERTGRRREALRLYAAVYRRFEENALHTADDLAQAGRAAARLGAFRDANEAFRTAYRIDPKHAALLGWWADLFREKYNPADARRTYEEALALRPQDADLLTGYARTFDAFDRQEALARKALAANPRHVEALSLLAGLHLLDGDDDAAAARAREALAVNPHDLTALGHLAATYYLRGDSAAFAATAARVTHPAPAPFYLTLARDAELRFRYDDAAAFARRAVTVAPDDAATHAMLGTALLRTGSFHEARRHLEIAYERDPFNLFVANTLTMLDTVDEHFTRLESPHFTLLLHRNDAGVLGPLVLEQAEAAFADLAARYPYRPPGKIVLELYDEHSDFAVRVAGLPHAGLLGVSFGDIVAMDSPRARAGEAYNWARTLRHELAHTFSIGASKHRVPRWFTEGLSVYEEQRFRPAWGRDMDLELLAAFDRGQLLSLHEIDRGFTRPTFPGQVMLSYYHAGQVVGFLVEHHGFEAVAAILQDLGAGRSMDEAVRAATGQPLDALDAAFRAHLRRERSRLAALLETLPGDATAPDFAGAPDNPFFRALRAGHDALRTGRLDEAETRFRQALTLYPDYARDASPYHGLAAVYRARADTAALVDILTRFLDVSDAGAAEARELAALHRAAGRTEAARRYLERTLDVEPLDAPTHAALAELYTEAGDLERAVRARRAVVALDPVDRARALYLLAEALYRNREHDAARRTVLQALELAPGFRDAQRLLLQCVEAGEKTGTEKRE
ncbi:MAG: hypothetical protein KatS3mg043_1659 [Rhodothermaceae bacterium]|nr:MAG: hypothetical protein KatS3mg043_1659 [Rhodothermaceae bacterium]